MLGLNVRRAELAGLIPRKKDHAPRLFCVPLEHVTLTPIPAATSAAKHRSLPPVRTTVLPRKKPFPSGHACVARSNLLRTKPSVSARADQNLKCPFAPYVNS